MSLINDMLRDLEQRRQKEVRLQQHVRDPYAVTASRRSLLAVWLGGTVLVIGLTVLGIRLGPQLLFSQPATPLGATAPTLSEPRRADQDVPRAVQSTEKAGPEVANPPVKSAATGIRPLPEETQSPVVTERVATLEQIRISGEDQSARINLVFTDLPDYRLLQDIRNDKALVIAFQKTRLGAVLEIPSFTNELLSGVSLRPQQEELQLLIDLASTARVEGIAVEEKGAQRYELVIAVVPGPPARERPAQPVERIAAVQVSPEPAQSTELVVSTSAESGQQKPAAAPEERINKTRNALSPYQQAFAEGDKALQEGHPAVAVTAFSQALQLRPEMTQARLRLIESLHQQGRIEQVVAQLQEGLEQDPASPDLRKLYARHLYAQQQYDQALGVLAPAPFPGVSRDLEYHALWAATLQELGRYEAAGQIYQRLVQVRPGNALWWFGLALSWDQVGDSEPARRAYRQALALPDLATNLRDYCQQRLQRL